MHLETRLTGSKDKLRRVINIMLNTILGTKQRMSHTYVEETRVPVTWIKAGPCIVTQIKRQEKDGYWAVQLGFGERKIKNTTKPLQGHLKGAIKENKAPRFLREVRTENDPDLKIGDNIEVTSIFKRGDVITVTGTSKGKGFQGVVKRWGFSGGPRTHGQSDRERAPGSIGQGTTPGRVLKGKKMAGRMGQDTVTIKNLIVVDVKPEDLLMAVSGSVPGKPGSLLKIKKIKEGSLEELVEEVPQVEIQVEEEAGDEVASEDKPVDTENANKQDEKTSDTKGGLAE